jgi:hypothetical protein
LSFAQLRIAARVKPDTGVILTYRGCPSSSNDSAATNGTLFSEPRPALPPLSSPPR